MHSFSIYWGPTVRQTLRFWGWIRQKAWNHISSGERQQTFLCHKSPSRPPGPQVLCSHLYLHVVPTTWTVFVWRLLWRMSGSRGCQKGITTGHAASWLPSVLVCVQGGLRVSGQILWGLWCLVQELHFSVLENWVLSSDLWDFQCHIWEVSCMLREVGDLQKSVCVMVLFPPLSKLLLALKESRTQTCMNSSTPLQIQQNWHL